MTVAELHSYFDLALDKVGSPFFTADEKDEFFNFAQRLLFNGIVRNSGSMSPQGMVVSNIGSIEAYENSSFSSEAISAMIQEISLDSDSSGIITYASINAKLSTEFYHLSTIFRKDSSKKDQSVRYVEVNDYSSNLFNSFKEPTDKFPIYRNIDQAIHVDPKTIASFTLTVTRTPKDIDLTSGQTSELLETAHERLIYNALTQAGINLREGEFYGMIKQESTTQA